MAGTYRRTRRGGVPGLVARVRAFAHTAIEKGRTVLSFILSSLACCLLGFAGVVSPQCIRRGAKPRTGGPNGDFSVAEPTASAAVSRSLPQTSSRGIGHQMRVPTLVLIDESPSEQMHLEELFLAADATASVMKEDPVVAVTAHVALGEFNSRVVISDFVPAADFNPKPNLGIGGDTRLGLALEESMNALDRYVAELRSQGIPVGRKLLIVLTDAMSRDSVDAAFARIHKAEDDGLCVLPVGVGMVDRSVLDRMSSRRPGAVLKDRNYRALFQWIARTVKEFSYSCSRPQEKVILPPADGWKECD